MSLLVNYGDLFGICKVIINSRILHPLTIVSESWHGLHNNLQLSTLCPGMNHPLQACYQIWPYLPPYRVQPLYPINYQEKSIYKPSNHKKRLLERRYQKTIKTYKIWCRRDKTVRILQIWQGVWHLRELVWSDFLMKILFNL